MSITSEGLFMAFVLTNDANDTLAPDNPAVLTHFLY